jgi:group I intron endonuclease
MNENKNIYKVYKYTNLINGKIYIGQTMESIEMRAGHNGYKYRKCPYFYNAIQKYGWKNFTSEILADNLTREQANELEIEYIKKFNSQNPEIGYNISDGGNTNSVLRKKIYQYSLNGEYIREWESLADARRFYGQEIVPMECGRMRSVGYQWSYEKLDKMPPNHNPNTGTSKKVYQYNLDGDFIAEYSSMSEAARANGADDPKHISQCCNNERRSAIGFRWSFERVDKLPYDNKVRFILKHKVAKIDPKTNEIIEEFSTTSEAAKTVMYKSKSKSSSIIDVGHRISHCCRKGLEYTCYGYKWMYID